MCSSVKIFAHACKLKNCKLWLNEKKNEAEISTRAFPLESPSNRGNKESASFQRGSKRRTSVDPISQVAHVPVLLGILSNSDDDDAEDDARLKMNLYFTSEIRDCPNLFSTPMALKTCLSYICNDGDQIQMEIRKTSRRRPRSVDDAELGHFTLFFCRGRQRNTKILTQVLSYCFAHYKTFC